jgi:cytochrome c-type biogenesis protein CcmF
MIGVATGLGVFAIGVRTWYVLAAFSLSAFTMVTVVAEFKRGITARCNMVNETPPQAFVNLFAKNNRRYGGYVVHLGVLMAFVGIVASSFYKTEVKKSVNPGESFAVGPYQLKYLKLTSADNPHMASLTAQVALSKNGREIGSLAPTKIFYKHPEQPATQVAIRSTPISDLYVVLAGIDDKSDLVTFDVFLTPLVFWLWAGGLVMAVGTVMAMWPNAREREAIAAAARRRAPSSMVAEPAAPGGD